MRTWHTSGRSGTSSALCPLEGAMRTAQALHELGSTYVLCPFEGSMRAVRRGPGQGGPAPVVTPRRVDEDQTATSGERGTIKL